MRELTLEEMSIVSGAFAVPSGSNTFTQGAPPPAAGNGVVMLPNVTLPDVATSILSAVGVSV